MRIELMAVTTCLLIGPTAGVAEDMRGGDLISACGEYSAGYSSAKAASCIAYLQGYLDGNTDITSAADRPSSFVVRALRTRATRLSEETEQKLNSTYCLPEGFELPALASDIAQEKPSAAAESAEQVLKNVLQRAYLCAPES